MRSLPTIAFCLLTVLLLVACQPSTPQPVATTQLSLFEPTSTPGPSLTPTHTLTPTPSPTSTPVPPTLTPTLEPLATLTAVYAQWSTYRNEDFLFELKYPGGSRLTELDETHARIDLPFNAGTNLTEKYLDIAVLTAPEICSSELAQAASLAAIQSDTVFVNGVQFLRERGSNSGADSFYDWEAYSSQKDIACVSLNFVLHSTNLENYPIPPTPFVIQDESAILSGILGNFRWLPGEVVVAAAPETPLAAETATPGATQAAAVEVTTPEPTQAAQMGTISGQLCYPAEGIPSLTVYARNTDTGQTYSVQVANDNQYQLQVPAGSRYQVFAWTNAAEQRLGGIYSCFGIFTGQLEYNNRQELTCGDRGDHIPLSVLVEPNQEVTDIYICDFYEQSAVPEP